MRISEHLNKKQIRNTLAQACKSAGGQSAWAMRNKISTAYVNDCLQGRRDIGDKISSALGFRREVYYVREAAR